MLENMKKTIKGLVIGSRKKYQIVGITFNELVEYILDKAAENNNSISQECIDNLSSKYKLDNKTYESLVDILLENNVNIESDFLGLLEENEPKPESQSSTEEEIPIDFSEKEILEELQKVDNESHLNKPEKIEKQDITLMMQIDKYHFLSYLSKSLPNHESSSKELVDEFQKQYGNELILDCKNVQTITCSHIEFYLPLTLTYLSKKKSLDALQEKYTEFFMEIKDFVYKHWNTEKNENTCLVIYSVAYFEALSYLYNIKPVFIKLLKDNFWCESYNDFVDSLYRYYENTPMKYEWDTYYEFSMYDSIINTCKSTDLNVCIDEKKYELAIAKCTTYEEIYEEDQTETKETEDVQDVSSEDEFDESIEVDDNVVEEVETNNHVEDSEENPINNGVLTLQDINGEILNENSEETNKEDISNNDDGLVDEVLSEKEMVEENDFSVDEDTDDAEKDEFFDNDSLVEHSEETDQNVDDDLINEVLSEETIVEESNISVDKVAEKIEQDESAADDTLVAKVVSEEELELNEVSDDKSVNTDTEDINEELVEENATESNDLSVDGEITEPASTTEIVEESKESDSVSENAAIVEYVQTNGYDNSWIDVILESDVLTFKNDFYVEFNLVYQTNVGTVLEDVDVYVTTSNGTVVHPYEYIDGLGPVPKKIDVHFNNKAYNLKFSPLFSLLRESSYMNDDFIFNVSFKDVMRGYKVRISYILEDDKWKTKEVFAYQVR
nr:hypothetical protein [Catenibacterium mitsuokai]